MLMSAIRTALFVFDDALIFPKLGVGLTLGLGMRAGKKAQDAI